MTCCPTGTRWKGNLRTKTTIARALSLNTMKRMYSFNTWFPNLPIWITEEYQQNMLSTWNVVLTCIFLSQHHASIDLNIKSFLMKDWIPHQCTERLIPWPYLAHTMGMTIPASTSYHNSVSHANTITPECLHDGRLSEKDAQSNGDMPQIAEYVYKVCDTHQ